MEIRLKDLRMLLMISLKLRVLSIFQIDIMPMLQILQNKCFKIIMAKFNIKLAFIVNMYLCIDHKLLV